MKARSRFVFGMATCVALALMSGSAVGSNGGGENTIVQVVGADVSGNDFMSNDADVDVETDDEDAAAAGCANQLNSAVNGVLALIAVADALGIIQDEDTLLIEDLIGLQDQTNVETDHHNQNATATCEQAVGSIVIIDDPVAGWGEAPPQGDAWSDLFSQNYIGHGGDGNTIVQVAGASASGDDIMSNDLDLDVEADDDDSAAAGCVNQMNLVANGVFVGVAAASAQAAILDNDFENITLDGRNGGGIIAQQDQTNVETNHHNRTATATCVQTLESYELFIGGEGKNGFPPQS